MDLTFVGARKCGSLQLRGINQACEQLLHSQEQGHMESAESMARTRVLAGSDDWMAVGMLFFQNEAHEERMKTQS